MPEKNHKEVFVVVSVYFSTSPSNQFILPNHTAEYKPVQNFANKEFSTHEEAIEYISDMLKHHKDSQFQIQKVYKSA